MAKRSREAGYSEQDTKLALYAVTALADETVMAATGAVRDYWATRPLQLVLFAENVAGERFFEHLESVRCHPQQVDVLRVYYLCLLFGFRGRYGVRGAEVTIGDLLDSVRAQLMRSLSMPEALSPNGMRPEEGLTDSVQRLPVLAVSVAVMALAGVLYLGLWVSLANQLRQFEVWTQQAGGRV
jgi:type VI secretion system protein ImpK